MVMKIKYTNKYGLPANLASAIMKDDYDNPDGVISATTLIDEPYRYALAQSVDMVEEDVSDGLWRLLGHATHNIIERSGEGIRETRFFGEMDGIRLSGKPDVYMIGDRAIEDWKITSKYTVRFNKYKPEWEKQLNVLAWLLRANDLSVKELRIHAILRDWLKSDGLKHDFPDRPFVSFDIPLWSNEEADEYIKGRVALFKYYLSRPVFDLPVCSEEGRWNSGITYKVYGANKARSLKNFTNMDEANAYAEGKAVEVVAVQGEDKRCKEYCNLKEVCRHGKHV
jgi:hypothetical protein